MFDELQTYLLQVLPPPRVAVLVDLAEAIASSGNTAHTYGITQILAFAEDDDKYITIESITTLLEDTARRILQEFGIQLEDEVPHTVITAVLKGVNTIDNYEDRDQLLGIIAAEEDPAHTFSELLDVALDVSWADTMLYISDVKPSLITRIAERLNAQRENQGLDEMQYPQDDIQPQRKRLMSYVIYRRQLLVLQAIHDGLKLGLPFAESYAPYTERLVALSPDRLAEELLGFALASDVPDGQIRAAISAELDKLVHDINVITKVDTALDPLLAKVSYAQA